MCLDKLPLARLDNKQGMYNDVRNMNKTEICMLNLTCEGRYIDAWDMDITENCMVTLICEVGMQMLGI